MAGRKKTGCLISLKSFIQIFFIHQTKLLHMKKRLTAILVCLFISSAQLQAQRIIDSLVGPESILKVGNKLFVSNMRGGFISELSMDGKFIRKNFSKSVLHAPKGLAAINNTIYVTDTSRVVGFDMNSGELVFELDIPKATFLNDLCTVEKNELAVTDSKSDHIYLINVSDKAIQFLGSVAGANGITYDAKTKRLYACGVGPQWNGEGKLYEKDISKNDTLFTELQHSPTGFFDGIELMDDDHLIVDDWTHNGRLFIYDLKNHTSTSYTVNSGTADLYYDKSSGDVYIPDPRKDRILIVNIKDLKKD
jgi:DNA-binding beta-propeller fold protein YncE